MPDYFQKMYSDADNHIDGGRKRSTQLCNEAGHDLCVLYDAWSDGCLCVV